MSIRRFFQALGRHAPLFLPALAVAVVGLVVLRLGKAHPTLGARLRGGPTEGAHALSYRLEVVERLDDTARGVSGRAASVEARLGTGELMTWQGTLDAEGAAAVAFPPRRPGPAGTVAGSVVLSVMLDGVRGPIAEASVSVSRARWAGTARRRGGWVEGPRVGGGLRLRAAAARGAFAVPFADALLVDARRANGAFAGAITCECDTGKEPRVPAVIFSSPGALPARALVRPLEHATSVPLVARDADGAMALLDVTLAVVPGALHAELVPEGVRVESPIARERAYVAVVTETERLAGGTVVLYGTDRGTAEGVLAVALPAEGPLWAVVSSEPDLGSAALVGWPLLLGPEAAPSAPSAPDGAAPTTFDVPDVLVLDSVGSRMQRELGRARRARLLAALFAVSAILLAAVLVARGARTAQDALEAHLAESGTDSETTTRVATPDGGIAGLVAVAVLCLVLGAALVGVFAAWV